MLAIAGMRTAVLCMLLLLIPLAITKTNYTCLDDQRYLALDICIIANFQTNHSVDLTYVVLPNVTRLEFLNSTVVHFGVDMFQLAGDAKRVTLRNGFVPEVLIYSQTIEELKVLGTDLVELDAVAKLSYTLKKLVVRSLVFSRWSSTLRFLTTLEVIDIAYCNFYHLHLDWFVTFEQLRMLDVSKNRLHSVHSTPFLRLNALEFFSVWGNQLKFLWMFPDAFPRLTLVGLFENKWVCEWVFNARNAIWHRRITLLGSDYYCEQGWVNNGGLCCRRSEDKRSSDGQDKQIFR